VKLVKINRKQLMTFSEKLESRDDETNHAKVGTVFHKLKCNHTDLSLKCLLWMKIILLVTSPNNEIYGSAYFGPAVIVGQLSGVQNSVSVPYRRLTWLKKSTAEKKNRHC
jgi:hypothetical protein